jgi:ankyrin repeat protein
MWASKNNHVEVVKLLVAAKANKDTQNRVKTIPVEPVLLSFAGGSISDCFAQ